MTELTITFEGVEIPDFGECEFPYSLIELKRSCKVCFFQGFGPA